jgi:hypothetical protein
LVLEHQALGLHRSGGSQTPARQQHQRTHLRYDLQQ